MGIRGNVTISQHGEYEICETTKSVSIMRGKRTGITTPKRWKRLLEEVGMDTACRQVVEGTVGKRERTRLPGGTE